MPESTGEESLSTYIFESNSEGEKVFCLSLSKAVFRESGFSLSIQTPGSGASVQAEYSLTR